MISCYVATALLGLPFSVLAWWLLTDEQPPRTERFQQSNRRGTPDRVGPRHHRRRCGVVRRTQRSPGSRRVRSLDDTNLRSNVKRSGNRCAALFAPASLQTLQFRISEWGFAHARPSLAHNLHFLNLIPVTWSSPLQGEKGEGTA
jgi:hypothetical protein